MSSTLVVGRLAWLYLDLPVANVQDTFFSGKGHVEPMDFLFLNRSVSERAIASSFALLQSAIIHACHNTKEKGQISEYELWLMYKLVKSPEAKKQLYV